MPSDPDAHCFLPQVHAYIISSLKKEMPNVFGYESKKKELVNNLGEIYQKIEREHQISSGDFPSLRKMQVWSPGQPAWCWVLVLGGIPALQGRASTKGSSWVSHQFPIRVRVDLGRDTDTRKGNVVTQLWGGAWLSVNLHSSPARMVLL